MVKKYNEIEVKDNMKIEKDNNGEEVEVVEKKEMKKVLNAQPQKVKRGLFSRLVNGVAGPEGVQGIGPYVRDEIIVPAIKNAIVDTVTSGTNILVDAITSSIRMAVFGEDKQPTRGHYRRSSGGYSRPTTNYTSRYTSSNPEPSDRKIARSRRPGVGEYVIPDRHDATNVLHALTEHADLYDSVSVADYYDAIGVDTEYTDHNYGWTLDSITRATIISVRGGYIIKFPPTELI